MITTDYRPVAVQVKYAKRGERVATSWNVPAGWPESFETLGSAPFRRIVLGIEKRSRAGSTGRIRWDLYEVLGDHREFLDIASGSGTFSDLETALAARHLAI